MKTRNGLVSNSSSSSFIIGLAFVPSDKLKNVRRDVGNNGTFKDYGDVIDMSEKKCWYDYGYSPESDQFFVEGFNGSSITIDGVMSLFEKDPDAAILVLDDSGAEPMWDDDYGSYNYNEVNESTEWFSRQSLDTANKIRSLGGDVKIGAGFNG